MLPGYGRMLTILAQYIATADDPSMLSTGTDEGQDISRHVDAVVGMIEARIARALQLPPGHIAHGLPLGCDEADSCTEYSTFTGSFGDLPYFSARGAAGRQRSFHSFHCACVRDAPRIHHPGLELPEDPLMGGVGAPNPLAHII